MTLGSRASLRDVGKHTGRPRCWGVPDLQGRERDQRRPDHLTRHKPYSGAFERFRVGGRRAATGETRAGVHCVVEFLQQGRQEARTPCRTRRLGADGQSDWRR